MTPYGLWYLQEMQYSSTAAGVQAIAVTDAPCHLWLRWSTHEPRIHLDPRLKRGLAFRFMPRYCFTVYQDVEQEEAGDTYVHTFIVEPWPVCQTRWFYLFGQIGGVDVPSESPLMSYHREAPPVTDTFYIHPGIGTPGVDGFAARKGVSELWPDLMSGVGTLADPAHAALYLEFKATTATDKWVQNYRSLLGFDCNALPGAIDVISAQVHLYCSAKGINIVNSPLYHIFQAKPFFPDTVIPGDYSVIESIPLSEFGINHASIYVNNYNIWELNASGLALIKQGIVNLAIREYTFDVLGNIPTWRSWATATVTLASSQSLPTRIPYLSVTYKAL